ncbi:MAG: hypothetical protein ACFFAO_21050 [Candidatus Hermodarchaeota archaeon]
MILQATADEAAAAYTAILMTWIIIMVVIWILFLLIAIWAYKDAQKRNMDNPIVWFFVVCCLGCIGLIIYLLVRKK